MPDAGPGHGRRRGSGQGRLAAGHGRQRPGAGGGLRLTAADLVFNPAEAITDNTITCCLCGKAACSLTSRHLANHGINVEEYKYLCGYPSEQKLMSRNFEAKMRRNVQRAQQARKEKHRAENA
ncbi:MucR family transcriptional regulator [Desulfovibrio sp.]|uniref:MucR family transcriptional regulator n=1 Tax=Desulfovibrio sp. TaxID=885 RepID=UPI003078552C